MWFDAFVANVLVAIVGALVGLSCITLIIFAFAKPAGTKTYVRVTMFSKWLFYVGSLFLLLGAAATIASQPQHVASLFAKLGIPSFLISFIILASRQNPKK